MSPSAVYVASAQCVCACVGRDMLDAVQGSSVWEQAEWMEGSRKAVQCPKNVCTVLTQWVPCPDTVASLS